MATPYSLSRWKYLGGSCRTMKSTRPLLTVRADANKEMGGGHVMRSLALAQAWKASGGAVIFLGSCEGGWIAEHIAKSGAQFVPIANPHPCPQDLEMTLESMDGHPGAWLLLDGYRFEACYQRSIKEAGHRVLLFDDTAQGEHYYADVIVNQNIGSERLRYPCLPTSRLLLGPRYAVLRPEYLTWQDWRRTVPEVASRVLVTLGASDLHDQTSKVIEAFRIIGRSDLEITVVGGVGGPGVQSLDLNDEVHSPRIWVREAVDNMVELMAWADVAVSAGGITCYELAFMGLPNIIMILSENQRATAQGMAAAGASVNLGWYENVTVEDIARAASDLLKDVERRRNMSQTGRTLVDGQGCWRVIGEMERC